MATFAVLVNSVVSNIIVADSKEIAEEATSATCIEYTEIDTVNIGWTWDGTKFTNEPTVIEAPTE
jgi:hypothetical protein